MAPVPTKKSGPSPIGEMLKEFLSNALPKSLGDETKVFGAWPAAVGPEISRQAQPRAFKNGILFVETKHPIWTTELTAKRHLIQRRINESLGRELVREIHFRQARL
jgi:predicted nucleic acid-binding Zn ribbon protein